jgi:regulator of replication initiation timing
MSAPAPRERITPRGERITPRSATSADPRRAARQASPLHGEHLRGGSSLRSRREGVAGTPLSLDRGLMGVHAASHPSPGGSVNNPHVRNPSPVRIIAQGDNRREKHLASQSLSKAAAEMKGQLALEKQLTALQKRFSITDEQLTQCKMELRSSRRDNERLQLEHEEMLRRIHAAQAERASAVKELAEAKEDNSKLESRLTIAVNQRGKGVIEREAKASV